MHAEMGCEIGGILCCGTCELAGLVQRNSAHSTSTQGRPGSTVWSLYRSGNGNMPHAILFHDNKKIQLGGGSCIIALIHLLVLLIRSLHSLRVQAPPGAVRR